MPSKKPKLTPSLEAFYNQLLEEGKLSEQETDFINNLLGKDEVQSVFNKGVHATKILDEERNQLKTKQESLEKDYTRKLGELESLQRTYASTSSTNTTKLAELEKQMQAKQAALDDVVTQFKTLHSALATQYEGGGKVLSDLNLSNIDFSRFTNGSAQSSNPQTKPLDAQPSFTKDDLLKEVTGMFTANAQVLARLPFDLAKYQAEYRQLTGKELDPQEFYSKVQADGTGNYEQVYLKEYNIPELRETYKTNLLRAEIEKEYQDKFEQERSKLLIPSNSTQNQNSVAMQALSSNIPAEERNAPSGNGLNDRVSLISEAVADFAKQQQRSA